MTVTTTGATRVAFRPLIHPTESLVTPAMQVRPAEYERIVIALYADVAPNAVDNFIHLCLGDKGKAKGSGVPLHYQGVRFHRLVPGSLIQGGDFALGNGTGGESIWGGK